jgi:hypothetical protein
MQGHRVFRKFAAGACAGLLLALGLGAAARGEQPAAAPKTGDDPRAAVRAEPPKVKHPNLLLNGEEIEQIKRKIRTQDWAAKLFDQVKGLAEASVTKGARNPRETALSYALTGEKRYADAVRRLLLDQARGAQQEVKKLDLKLQPERGAWDTWGVYAWAYDLTYDTFSDEERGLVESWLREGCRIVIQGEKLWTTTPNLVFGKHFNVGLVGYCLGDKELIDWGLNDPGAHGPGKGGFYQVMDAMIQDGHFWAEAPIYALHYDVHGMLALAEAALHYDGTDLYHYVSKKSGASIKSVIDGYVRLGYPLERTGIGRGSVRMATFADGATGYSPRGELFETFLINPADPARTPAFSGELEIAYKRYQDPGYAWLLSLNPKRDASITYGRAVWGYVALTHGEPLPEKVAPPPAPGGVYPGLGFALLRADESPDYWTSGGLATLVMLGKWVGHGHSDDYSLILHGKGRLLYPDLNVIQYEPSYLNWTHEGIAHNTLLVDHQSPAHGPFTTRHDFDEDVKHFAIAGTAYPGVRQTRALLLTKQYLADFFQAADTEDPPRPHVFDWVLHGLGRLYVGNPGAYRPTDSLVPFYWWVDNERGRTVDATWQADWIQRSAGVTPGLQAFGNEWFQHEVGVRMTMAGSKGTQVYAGDGPFTDGPPYHRIDGNPEGSLPMLVVRREAPSAIFAAVHEPYEGRPRIQQVRRVAETAAATAMMVQAPEFTDYLMTAFEEGRHTLSAATGEVFAFSDYGYLRMEKGAVQARGKISGFRVPAPSRPLDGEALVNGKKERLRKTGGFLEWGELPKESPPAPTGEAAENPPEHSAWVHTWFLPEEVHLAAGGEKEVEMHLRSVGEGRPSGQLRLAAPQGLTVEPTHVAVEPLEAGQERIVRLKVAAAKEAANSLREIRLAPEQGLQAAPQTLLVSTGVVMTADNRVPKSAQFVVRAPGYTMKVDHYSGVSFYLLDADGHRRFGRVTRGNFLTGFAGVACEGKWSLLFGLPCEGIWAGPNNLTVRSLSLGGAPNARLLYTFLADRISIAVVPPTDTTKEFTMWLGNFDILGPPVHNGKQEAPHLPIIADRFCFPHPMYRQGVLLITPAKTALQFRETSVSFPIRTGQEISLQFVEQGEAQVR